MNFLNKATNGYWGRIIWGRFGDGLDYCFTSEGYKANGLFRPFGKSLKIKAKWWAILGSNQWPLPCEGSALPLS
jgi:hypothetical protein